MSQDQKSGKWNYHFIDQTWSSIYRQTFKCENQEMMRVKPILS